jgi:hypothetical protein
MFDGEMGFAAFGGKYQACLSLTDELYKMRFVPSNSSASYITGTRLRIQVGV